MGGGAEAPRMVEGGFGSIFTGKAIVYPQQAQLHPIKYLVGLAQAIVNRGGAIYTHSHATSFTGGPEGMVVTTDGGSVRCKDIVLATCNPVLNSWNMIIKQEPMRTYVIVGQVPKGSVPNALFWDTEDPYHYVRLSPHTAQYDWLIVGGEDHRVGMHPTHIDTLYANLEAWARARFPTLCAQIHYKWSGQVWEPLDMLGYFGHKPSGPQNIYVITGDSGTGLTNTTIGAKVVTDLIVGRDNKWANLYAPSRMPSVKTTGDFLKSAGKLSAAYLKWVNAGEVKDIEDIRPCSGAVMRKGLHYTAVYKDETGAVFECSAVCTHLKAIVKWNDDEKSWDCPAHGSRFDRFGKVISGPANEDLSRA